MSYEKRKHLDVETDCCAATTPNQTCYQYKTKHEIATIHRRPSPRLLTWSFTRMVICSESGLVSAGASDMVDWSDLFCIRCDVNFFMVRMQRRSWMGSGYQRRFTPCHHSPSLCTNHTAVYLTCMFGYVLYPCPHTHSTARAQQKQWEQKAPNSSLIISIISSILSYPFVHAQSNTTSHL